MEDPRSVLNAALRTVVKELIPSLSEEEIEQGVFVEPSRDQSHGHLSTTLAMRFAKPAGMKPRDLAEQVCRHLEAGEGDCTKVAEAAEVAGPGFINFRFSHEYLTAGLREVHGQDERYGASDQGSGTRVQIEFASANPTGPLSVAHGRQAALGDAMGNVLAFAGHEVSREYYINDTGNQIRLLGESVFARYAEELGADAAFPEDGYFGDYIRDIAKQVVESDGDKFVRCPREEAVEQIARLAVDVILKGIKDDLSRMQVVHDSWFSQDVFEKTQSVEEMLAGLEQRGLLYEKDSATWLKSTEFGDEQDRVMVKSDGLLTYRTPDMAYHQNKYERGFDQIITMVGPDHHAHTIFMVAAMKALGHDPESLHMLIVQYCTLLKGGEKVKMSTRAGQYVTLAEVMDEIGVDATRYFFLIRRTDSHLDFDLEVAKKQSLENPVYYVQYACARTASVVRKALEDGRLDPSHFEGCRYSPPEVDLSCLEDRDLELAAGLLVFPEVVARAAQQLEPHHLTAYAYQLAGNFHNYWDQCRIVHEETVPLPLTKARLYLASALRIVLENCLRLLGVSAPEHM